MFDLGIENGHVYIDGKFLKTNLYIKDRKIAEISDNNLECKQCYDASDKKVMPGFIDPHVHFALTVGKNTSSDDFESGSKAAALGGVTTFIDFLDPVKTAGEMKIAFENRLHLAKNSSIDYSFHACIANPTDTTENLFTQMKELGLPTLKLFTTYSASDRRTFDKDIVRLLLKSKQYGVMLLVHAENEAIVLEGHPVPISEHGEARPAISEISEVVKLAEITKYTNGRLYVVHTSCGSTLDSLKKNYSELLQKDLIIESCPHYFYFTSDLYKGKDGHLFTMTPPLRSEYEKNLLKENIDTVDIIATDHCPFDSVLKNKKFTNEVAMGIGGVEISFPLMYTMFGDAIIDKYTKNPAMLHGLYPRKGTISIGSDADIVIYDPNVEKVISHELNNKGKTNADYTCYEGMKVQGKVVSTISNGLFVVKDGKFKDGNGNFLTRVL